MARTLVHQPPTAPAVGWTVTPYEHLIGWGVTLAMAVAAALRLPFLSHSFWFDEIYTAHVVEPASLAQVWHRIGVTESTPPLFYLLTHWWSSFLERDGEATLRSVSVLATVLAVPVAYAALRRIAGPLAAFAAASLVAVSPLLVGYGLDARAYGLLVLAGLVSVGACGALLDRMSTRRLVGWTLAAAVAIWTHWFAGFLVLGEVVALLWLRPRAWRATLLAAAGVLVLLLPLLELLREQMGDDRAAFIASSGLGGRLEQLVRQFAAGPNVPRTSLEAAALIISLGALAAGTLLTARRALGPPQEVTRQIAAERRMFGDIDPRDGARALLVIVAIGLLTPLLLAALGIYDRFNVRNVLCLWPLAAALAAPALLRLRAAPLAVLILLGAVTSVWAQSNWRYGNADWRAAVRVIDSTPLFPLRPVLIAVTPISQPVVTYYTGLAASSEPYRTRHAWLVVEPARGAGHRSLQPVDSPLIRRLLTAFPTHHETRVHGFRVITLDAPRPVLLDPAQMPGATLFPVVRSAAG